MIVNKQLKPTQFQGAPTIGFTLVEILVSVSILTLLIMLLASIASSVSAAWARGQMNSEMRQTGRSILDFMASELERALIGASNVEVVSFDTGGASDILLASTKNDLQFVVGNISSSSSSNYNPTDISSDYLNSSAIFWQAPIARPGEGLGQVAQVGYFVRWLDVDNDSATPDTPQLCRYVVGPEAYNSEINYLVFKREDEGNRINWIEAGKIDAVAKPVVTNDYKGWFADQVLAFYVRCLDPEGKLIEKDADGNEMSPGAFDSRRGYSYKSLGKDVVVQPPALPAAVELAILMVDVRGLARYNSDRLNLLKEEICKVDDVPSVFWEKGIPGLLAHEIMGPLRATARLYSTTVHLQNAH